MKVGRLSNYLGRLVALLAVYAGSMLVTAAADTNAPAPANLPSPAAQLHQRWVLLGFIALLLIIAWVYRSRRSGARTAQ